MRKFVFTAITLIPIMLAGCDTNAGTVDLTVKETSAEITEVTYETIHMNNCGSAGDVKQTAERSKSVNVEYAGSFGVDKVVVNGEVSAKYEEINATAKKIELTAPGGTNMEFKLKWTEKTWVGVVTAQGKDGQANYKVSVPISVELESSNDLGCGSPSNDVPANPTSLPPATQKPSQTSEPNTQITQTEIDAALGVGNWFCYPDRQDGIGVKSIPTNLVVQYPLRNLEKDGVFYSVGEAVPTGGSKSGTGWLQNTLPRSECPNQVTDADSQVPVTKETVNAILGDGNWFCFADRYDGVKVKDVPPNFIVKAPLSNVDREGTKYGYGETVPSGGSATAWLQSALDSNECP